MIRKGLGLFFRIATRSPDIEVEESDEEAGEAEERPESSPSSPDENNADENAEFEVFLSFRGKDTRKLFIAHLYENLTQRGVKAFIDSKNLPKGERVDRLHRYVQHSKVFLPVFSKGYADSKWCIREISTAVKCKKKIIPVFFDVEPSDLKGRGCFTRSFQNHAKNKKLDQQKVKSWVDACKEAGSICGYHLQNDTAGHEEQLIQMIVKDVMTRVRTHLLDVVKHPVGLKPRVEEIKGMLLQDLEGNGVVRMIGIHGMGGIGKTTLAKAVYNEIERNFDACSYLSDVQETSRMPQGLHFLQTRMVRDISRENNEGQDRSRGTQAIKEVASDKKVLVVLDNVDHPNQLEALVGDGDWFGKGSCIIITTRDKSVLIHHGIEEGKMYEIDGLNNDDQSMELFCYHAFRSKQPPDERYKRLAKEVVFITEGVPLVLEVLGSQFFDMKTPNEWKALIKKLKKYPSTDVHGLLRISYDELHECEKEVFLDIACFFIGRNKEYPMLMWEDCEFRPSFAIQILLHKSLIKMTTQYNKWRHSEEEVFLMHDQIREMGRNIVLQERGSFTHLSRRRSRFWNTTTTVIEELQTMEEPRSVQGIELSWREEIPISANLWERHPQLRYLHFDGVTFQGNRLQFPAHLKWLSSTDCELEQPPTCDFDPGESIVVLELFECSHLASAFVEQSFLCIPKISLRSQGFEKLKVVDLSSTDINTTPNFSNVPCPNLEKMKLHDCRKLRTVHESIGLLKRLEILDLGRCTQLYSLPTTLGGMASLEELVLIYTDIETLPDSIGELRNLKQLHLDHCRKFSYLPDTVGGMTSLEKLLLDRTSIKTLPDSIGVLGNLKVLSVWGCKRLKSVPNDFKAS